MRKSLFKQTGRHTDNNKICGPTTEGPHVDRQHGPKRISCFNFRGAQTQSPRSSGTGVLRRAQVQNCHPRSGKLWAPRQIRQRSDRSGSRKYSRRAGRIVPIAGRCLQGTPIPNHLCDHSGRDFAQLSSIETSSEGPQNREGAEGRSGTTAVSGLGWEC